MLGWVLNCLIQARSDLALAGDIRAKPSDSTGLVAGLRPVGRSDYWTS